jgi:hypothetical protein
VSFRFTLLLYTKPGNFAGSGAKKNPGEVSIDRFLLPINGILFS